MRKREFIDGLTAELRVGRAAWREIRPRIKHYVLPEGAEFFDWREICQLIDRTARVKRPHVIAGHLKAPASRRAHRGAAQELTGEPDS